MGKVYLSVIIPSYNETENLKRGVLEAVNSYLKKQSYTWEVIISDDGSPDEESKRLASVFCAKNPGFKFLANEHAGKHFAVWAGIQESRGEIVLFTDMDQSTPISEVTKLLSYYEKGYDVAIGSRGLKRENFSWFRKLASVIFGNFRRFLLLGEIIDTQAGFKSLRGIVAKEIFPMMEVIRNTNAQAQGWKVSAFDVEMLVIAKKKGYKIAEVPVDWEDADVSKGKKRGVGKFVYESVDMLKEIVRVRLNDIRGYYNP